MAKAITKACEKYSFSLIAYVFMPTHVHLIVRPKQSPHKIDSFLRSVKMSVSKKAKYRLVENDPRWLEKLTVKNHSTGKAVFRFWQPGGGYDRNISDEATLKKMIEYIHNNPVRKAFVEDSNKWRWSSASFYFHENAGPCEVVNPFV